MTKLPSYIFVNDLTIRIAKMPNVLRSEMEAGMQRTRKLQSRTTKQYSCELSICTDKEASFDEWFDSDLASGAFWFLMNNPINGKEQRFRFVEYEITWTKTGDVLTSPIILESYGD